MNRPTPEQQRAIVRQWEETGRVLERLRREALRGRPYRAEEVEALLDLGRGYDGPPRYGEGMVEMQRLFMAHARRMGWMPAAADAPGEE